MCGLTVLSVSHFKGNTKCWWIWLISLFHTTVIYHFNRLQNWVHIRLPAVLTIPFMDNYIDICRTYEFYSDDAIAIESASFRKCTPPTGEGAKSGRKSRDLHLCPDLCFYNNFLRYLVWINIFITIIIGHKMVLNITCNCVTVYAQSIFIPVRINLKIIKISNLTNIENS